MNAAIPSSPKPADTGPQHWVIAYASSHSAPLQQALSTLYLPHLEKALAGMACASASDFESEIKSPLLPHENAPALWHQAPVWGDEALITPCHWQVGMNEVLLLNPAELRLSADESQQMLATVQPYFEEDGLHLAYESPLVWRAKGLLLQDMPFASLEKVAGQQVKEWLPQGPHARTLQRLQSEMQMLLYQHPVNDLRSQQGRWTVNAFWVHRTLAQLYPSTPQAQIRLDLRDAASSANAEGWRQQWQTLDAQIGEALQSSTACMASITLCSETHWRHYRPHNPSWLHTLKRMLSPLKVHTELRALTAGVSIP
jgi:hypothetical protein